MQTAHVEIQPKRRYSIRTCQRQVTDDEATERAGIPCLSQGTLHVADQHYNAKRSIIIWNKLLLWSEFNRVKSAQQNLCGGAPT